MTKHANLSGSGAHRWIKCPGSIRMTRGIERKSGAAARQGTQAHALGEQILRYWLKTGEGERGLRARYKQGTSFKWDDHGEACSDVVTQEMLDHVMVYVLRILEIKRLHPQAEVYLETHVDLKNVVRDGMFGTVDCVVWIPVGRTLYVIDFKYGYTPVHVVLDGELNAQLMYYAAGAIDAFNARGLTPTRVFLEVVQPRCMEVEPVQSHGVYPHDVMAWAQNTLWAAAHATDAPDAPLVAGDHCRFCDALADCPTAGNMADEQAATDFGELAMAHSAIAIRNLVPVVPKDSDRLSKILKAKPIIKAWLDACEERAFEEMQRGVDVDGFELAKKKSNREWPTEDERELIALLRKAGYKKAIAVGHDLIAKKLLSPAQLEKIIGKETVNKVAVKPDNGLAVVRRDDAARRDFKELL